MHYRSVQYLPNSCYKKVLLDLNMCRLDTALEHQRHWGTSYPEDTLYKSHYWGCLYSNLGSEMYSDIVVRDLANYCNEEEGNL